MPSSVIGTTVGNTARHNQEQENFAGARSGAGEAVGGDAAQTPSPGGPLSAMNVGLRVDNVKDGGPPIQILQSYSILRYFMVFPIPDLSGATVTSATIKLTSAGYTVTGASGNNRYFQSKGKFVAGTLADESTVAAGDYDSINVSSLTDYDDESGITISPTSGESVTTSLNSNALTKINTLTSGGNFVVCLMEYEHDHQNNGVGSWQTVLGSSASSRGLDGFHIAENGESNEPELTINYGSVAKAGKVTITNKIPIMNGKISLVDVVS